MRNLRTDRQQAARERAGWLRSRIGTELRIARVTAGLTQEQVGRAAGVGQMVVSRAERGVGHVRLDTVSRVAAATGHDLSVRLYPSATVSLRDSGQLAAAQAISNAADNRWTVTLEAPVAPGDRRAADMLLTGPGGQIHVEIERALVDIQAQLRAAQIKRDSLAHRLGAPVRLVLVVGDTPRNRSAVRSASDLLARAMPARPCDIWTALRAGAPLESDGILFLRVRRAGTHG